MLKWILAAVLLGSVIVGGYKYVELQRELKRDAKIKALYVYQKIVADSDMEMMCLEEYRDKSSRYFDVISKNDLISYRDFILVNTKGLLACKDINPNQLTTFNSQSARLNYIRRGSAALDEAILKRDSFVSASDCAEHIVRLEGVCPTFFSFKVSIL